MTYPLPYAWRYRFITFWPRFHAWLVGPLCGVYYIVEGKEHLPKDAAIVMAKHQSTWETFAFPAIFPPHVWVLKRELNWIPFFGWGIALLKPISIDRASGRKAVEQLIEQGRERLQSGLWVVIFPEGTRMPANTRGRYKMGGAILASETGFPVVPVAHNAGSFWPRQKFLIRPGVVRVVIGPAVESKNKTATAIRDEVEAWIEHTMQDLEGRDELAPLMKTQHDR